MASSQTFEEAIRAKNAQDVFARARRSLNELPKAQNRGTASAAADGAGAAAAGAALPPKRPKVDAAAAAAENAQRGYKIGVVSGYMPPFWGVVEV
jgi:hypothetical protein